MEVNENIKPKKPFSTKSFLRMKMRVVEDCIPKMVMPDISNNRMVLGFMDDECVWVYPMSKEKAIEVGETLIKCANQFLKDSSE
jgi:hypothetical protein